jgi:2-polyprenyl-3-methyl-5-hydroxy-6-metoxy-1,4-benzoquinol methylase
LSDTLHAVSAALKYTRFNDEPGSAHTLVVGLVPEGARVLEFGCATGYMSEVMRTSKGCRVTGIEIDPEAGELAKEHCDRVIIGDAEKLDYDELLGKERFDAILFVDVLEHLKEPGDVLARIRPFLSRRGSVLASIPNVAHGSVRLALLAGEFRYRRTGLLDDTHLRFFTRQGVQELFESTGFVISNWLTHRVDIDRTEVRFPEPPSSEPLRQWLSNDPETSVYQFVIRAVASNAANQLVALRSELAAASEQLLELENSRRAAEQAAELQEGAEQQAAELQERTAQQAQLIEGLRHRVQALAGQERETYESLLATQRQLLLREQEVSRNVSRNEKESERLQEQLAETARELEALKATKVWRLAGKWWRLRNAVFRRR